MKDRENRRPARIVGLGEVLWDVFPEGEAFGGAPANFACHCRSLGADAAVVSCVGDDDHGRRALAFLRAHGVDTTGLAQRAGAATGVVLVTLDAAGKPAYEIREGVAWDRIPWSDALGVLAARADAVCFGTLGQRSAASRETIRRFVRETSRDCLRVFDINLRQRYYDRALILAALESAHVLKLNDEELALLAPLLDLAGGVEEQLASLVRTFDLRLAVLTCGPRGAVMLSPGASSFAAPSAVSVVSTVGAGDAFTAAVVVGLLNGDPLDLINRRANALAAFVCSKHGAVPPLPAELLREWTRDAHAA